MSTRILLRSFAAAFLLALSSIAAVADGPAVQTGTSGSADPTTAAKASEVTVVGCLVRIDMSGGARPSTTGSTPPGRSRRDTSGFALKDALVWTGGEMPAGPINTRSDREFGLRKAGDVDFAAQAGRQVEVKGRLVTSFGDPASPDAAPHPSAGYSIEATSIRRINDGCPPR